MGRINHYVVALALVAVSSATADEGKRAPEEPQAMLLMGGKKPELPPAVAVREIKGVLAPEEPVAVHGVVTMRGTPVSGASVELRRSGEELLMRTLRTAADGKFAFDALAAGAYDVEVGDGSSSSSATGVRPAAGKAVQLELPLDPPSGALAVRGQVIAANGKPAAGARVQAMTYTIDWHAPSTPRAVHADEDGRFALFVANFGDVRLSAADRTGAARAEDDIKDIRRDTKRDLLLAGVDASSVCTGRVLDEQGKPATGATVGSYWSEASSEPAGTAVTADDGRYRVFCEARSQLVIRALRGGARARGQGKDGVELRLSRGARLRLQLVSHRPVEEVDIRWIPASEISPLVHFMSNPYERTRTAGRQAMSWTSTMYRAAIRSTCESSLRTAARQRAP